MSVLFRFGGPQSVPVNPELSLLLDARFYLFFALGVLFAFPWWRRVRVPRLLSQALPFARRGLSLGCLVLSLCSLAGGAYNPFIYFQF
jgi:alginate O-acetyltransferase complex protein AlgI